MFTLWWREGVDLRPNMCMAWREPEKEGGGKRLCALKVAPTAPRIRYQLNGVNRTLTVCPECRPRVEEILGSFEQLMSEMYCFEDDLFPPTRLHTTAPHDPPAVQVRASEVRQATRRAVREVMWNNKVFTSAEVRTTLAQAGYPVAEGVLLTKDDQDRFIELCEQEKVNPRFGKVVSPG